MLGLFGFIGRSKELQRLDRALRAVDLHPKLVPEAVKLTALKQLKEAEGGAPPLDAFESAAALIAYCMLGADAFAGANDEAQTQAVEGRIAAALEAGDSLDARLIMLTLQAGVIQPDVVDRFDLSMG